MLVWKDLVGGSGLIVSVVLALTYWQYLIHNVTVTISDLERYFVYLVRSVAVKQRQAVFKEIYERLCRHAIQVGCDKDDLAMSESEMQLIRVYQQKLLLLRAIRSLLIGISCVAVVCEGIELFTEWPLAHICCFFLYNYCECILLLSIHVSAILISRNACVVNL